MGTIAGRRSGAILANLAALATASAVHGQTRIIYVDDDASNPEMNGSSWEMAYNDLQYALYDIGGSGGMLSPSEVEIRIAQGTYRPDERYGSRSQTFRFYGSTVSGVSLTVLGGFAGIGTANPDLRDPSRFVTVLSGDLMNNDTHDPASWLDNSRMIATADLVGGFLMDGLMFKGARGADHPYDIYDGGALGISSRVATEHSRTARESSVVVRNCKFIDNIAGRWTAVVRCTPQEPQSHIRFEDCDFIRNRSIVETDWSVGGALSTFDGAVVIDRCRFIDNSAEFRGGAIYADPSSSLLIRDSLFVNNSAGVEGGAIYAPAFDKFWQAPQMVERCTFVQNQAAHGSDIACGLLQVTGSILHDDNANGSGSRIHVLPATGDALHMVTFEYTNMQGGQSSITGDGAVIRWLGGNIDLPPRYDAIYGLREDSPCIDAGSPRTLEATDRDVHGRIRVFDGNHDEKARVDMGASEWQLAPCPADFDGSGFVDTDDFDAFVRAFEAGC
jgi:predicted outer membrane repeat protein